MNIRIASHDEGGRRGHHALTLIELIGVLAVMALLAGLLVPVSLRHLDRVASRHEMAMLKSFGDALQARILRTKSMPTHTNWAHAVAAQTGIDLADVTTNIRRRARILLLDGGGWFSTNLNYNQTHTGTPVFPAGARLILMTSLGKELPITSGVASASD